MYVWYVCIILSHTPTFSVSLTVSLPLCLSVSLCLSVCLSPSLPPSLFLSLSLSLARSLSLSLSLSQDAEVTDCEALQDLVNPFCEFDTPTEWARKLHRKVREAGGFTIEFWVKVDGKTRIPVDNADYRANPASMRRIVFFSKLSPPRVLATITLRSNFDDLEFQAFGNCRAYHQARIAISFPKAAPLKPGAWFKITMVYGAKNEDGKRGIRILQGSQAAFQFMDELEWCETDDDFIQALQLPGGVLLSPIEITPMPLRTKEIQERFYWQKPMMDVRRGPAQPEEQRQTARISYQRANFIYPVSLMAPPIVLQKRIEVTSQCSTVAGTDYTQTLWNKTAFGSKCAPPYECGEALKNDSKQLLACTVPRSPPATFFGAPRLGPELGQMQGWFFEFLQV